MRAPSCTFAHALVCLATAATAQASSPDDTSAAFFRQLIIARLSTSVAGDTAAYRRFLDPAAVYVNDDGTRESADQHVKHIGARGPSKSTYKVDSVHVFRTGEFAMVDYAAIEHIPYGPRGLDFPGRIMDTFVRRNGRWFVLGHAETHATTSPEPMTLSPAALDEFVGRYEWWPGYVDTWTRDGNQLLDRAPGDKEATRNIAAAPDAFYEAGDASLLVFMRDKSGRVVGYLLHWPDGQVTVARKIP